MRFLGTSSLVLALLLSMSVGYGNADRQPSGSALAQISAALSPASTSKIKHVVIIFQENRSTDNLFHGLRGADIASSGMDSQGHVVPLVPVSLARAQTHYDVGHGHEAFVKEYNHGQMNGFDRVGMACLSNYIHDPRIAQNPMFTCTNPTAYGYVPRSEIEPYFALAERYTFADRMFQTNQGPSLPAHMYIISGTSILAPGSKLRMAENPTYDFSNGPTEFAPNCGGSPQSKVAMIDPEGNMNQFVPPCLDYPTLFDLLDAKGVSWKYYDAGPGGVWNAPSAIKHIRMGPDWQKVIIPQTRIFSDIASGELPAVSWVMPSSPASDHSMINTGEGPSWVGSVVNAIGNSPYWRSTAIFVTWDDWGGWYDHVKPPQYNSYELGFRVPLIVISPYAKRGYVSHVQHEFGSILRFTEETFHLGSLHYTDARSDDLRDCFNFARSPLMFGNIPTKQQAAYFIHQAPSNQVVDDDFDG